MFKNSDLASAIFFNLSWIYTLMGLYGFSLNKTRHLNRVFLFISLCLSNWALCFAFMAYAGANGYEVALFNNRISVIGWGVFYSAIYHFFKLLIDKTEKLKPKTYVLIYFPSVLNIIFFLCLGEISKAQFNMVYTKWGWVNSAISTPINLYFTIYSLTFSFLTLIKIIRCYIKANELTEKRQRGIVLFLYILAYSLSIGTDVVLNRILEQKNMQLTILWLMPPMLAMFYILLKNRVMHSKEKEYTHNILDEKKRSKLFEFTGYFYIAISYHTLLLNYFIASHQMQNQPYYSFFVYIVGISLFFIKPFLKKTHLQYSFITFVSVIMMALTHMRYYSYGGITVWVIFFFFIIIAIVFELNYCIYIIGISAIVIQFIHWFLVPELNVTLDWTDYYTRIVAIILSMIIVVYISNLYKNRIQENIKQLNLQKLITRVSAILIDSDIYDYKEKIANVLGICIEEFELSKAYLYSIAPTEKLNLLCYRGLPEDNEVKTLFDNISDDRLLFYHEDRSILNVYDLENPTENEILYFKEQKTLGFYVFPMSMENHLQKILVFEFIKPRKKISVYQYKKVVVELISQTLKKIEYEEKLYHNANYDNITDVKNRNCFTNEVSLILRNEELKRPAVIFLDIDNFKNINDAFGHSIGDLVLKRMANILKANLNNSSILARFGSDKFCIFYSDTTSIEEIQIRLDYILKIFEESAPIENYEFKLNINIGVSVYPDDGRDVFTLLKNADLAMNEAKKLGKMRYYFSNENDKNKILENAVYTNKLFNALSNNQFIVAYQPQMNCKTGKIIGAEALLRWKFDDKGFIPPFKFIPLLEHTGLIIRVGEWIIEQVAMQQVKMIELGIPKIRLSVNLSAVQFQDEKLIQKIKTILENWGVDTKYFEMEITEGVAIHNPKMVIDKFNKLKAMGCSIAIDDFGVEFSSLNRLQHLPLDRLKIDKSFVDGIGIDRKREAIIKIIIELAKSLNLESIAEGVETKEQLNFLKEQKCDEIQGYFFGKPMFAEEFEQFAKDHI